jgi:hypothetical protein
VSFSGISKPPKNVSALGLNQLDRILVTAITHFEKSMYDAGLGVPGRHQDIIERAIQQTVRSSLSQQSKKFLFQQSKKFLSECGKLAGWKNRRCWC